MLPVSPGCAGIPDPSAGAGSSISPSPACARLQNTARNCCRVKINGNCRVRGPVLGTWPWPRRVCGSREARKEKPLLGTKTRLAQLRSIQETFNSPRKAGRTGSCHLVSDGSRGGRKRLSGKRGKLGARRASDSLEMAPVEGLSDDFIGAPGELEPGWRRGRIRLERRQRLRERR